MHPALVIRSLPLLSAVLVPLGPWTLFPAVFVFPLLTLSAVGVPLRPPADLLVLVDDTALSCGMIRLRAEGGAGGHNGLADIEQKLGSGQYARLRIGIDGPGEIPQETYVLGRFRPEQRELLEPALEDAVDATVCWMAHGITEAMNRFNRRKTA